MKRIFTLILAGLLLFAAISCENAPAETTENTTTGDTIDPNAFERTISYGAQDALYAESPTRVLFFNLSKLYYYNKLTEEIGLFCFDPLCEHPNHYTCIAKRFWSAKNSCQVIRYSAHDNRFYGLRGEQLYSFAFDGSDFRHEASFGEEGKLENDDIYARRGTYKTSNMMYLSIWDRYVCFNRLDENGIWVVTCYDIETKKVTDLVGDNETMPHDVIATEQGVLTTLRGKHAGIYRINYDGTGLAQLSDDLNLYLFEIYDGENLYCLQRIDPNVLSPYVCQLVTVSLETWETKMLISEILNPMLLTATGDYIYYTVQENIPLGNYVSLSGSSRKVYNYFSKIYRCDKKTGEVLKVFDDIGYEITESICIIGDQVIINGAICYPSDTKAAKDYMALIGRIDENGMIVDLRPVE